MSLKKYSFGTLLTSAVTLVGCESPPQKPMLNMAPPMASLKATKIVHPMVLQSYQLIKEEKYAEAAKLINTALQSESKSVVLHLMNALVYEKLAENGDPAGYELAAVGYQNAINLDRTNAFAITQLGKLHNRQKQFDKAQECFANALLLKSTDGDLWHELAAASYNNFDAKTAVSAIEKARKLKPDDPLVHRSATLIHAALGNFETAKKHLAVFQNKVGKDPAVDYVNARYNDWKALYESGRIKLSDLNIPTTSVQPAVQTTTDENTAVISDAAATSEGGGEILLVQGGGGGGGGTIVGGGGDGGSDGALGGGGQTIAQVTANQAQAMLANPLAQGGAPRVEPDPQIIVDCYLLRITENATTSKGNNILDNLFVTLTPGGFMQFKGSAKGSAFQNATPANDAVTATPSIGFRPNQNQTGAATVGGQAPTFTSGNVPTTISGPGSFSGHIFSSGITWAGLTYSLNVANALDSRTEVVNRPSLMTFLNKPSIFFSGDELVAGFTGQYGGTLAKYPVGVTLEVTPEAIADDLVTFNIGIEGSLIALPNPDLHGNVDVQKTRIDTYVKVRFGETLMLGGMYERVNTTSKSGVPGLMDIPGLQYFFGNESTDNTRRSIVFMLTPRTPDAVKSAVKRAMAREAVEPNLGELISRTPDWFNPHPNMAMIFRYLAMDPVIYYEFRSNDILPPSWGWEPTIQLKLEQLKSFLYF